MAPAIKHYKTVILYVISGSQPMNRVISYGMSRYFFDVTHRGVLVQDEEGHELDGLQAVCAEAVAILPDLAREMKSDADHQTLAVTARDATGKPVFRAKLSLDCTWLE